MNDRVFSTDEIGVMREAFDVLRDELIESEEWIAQLVMRAARTLGADDTDAIIDCVHEMLKKPRS